MPAASRTKTEAQAALVRRYAKMLRAASGATATNRAVSTPKAVRAATRRFTRAGG
jgi:hypothetical protein